MASVISGHRDGRWPIAAHEAEERCTVLVGRGSLSFRSYEVSGKGSAPSAEKITERLERFQFSAESGGAEEGAQVGWVGPDHLFDGDFNSAKITRGRYTVFALRVD